MTHKSIRMPACKNSTEFRFRETIFSVLKYAIKYNKMMFVFYFWHKLYTWFVTPFHLITFSVSNGGTPKNESKVLLCDINVRLHGLCRCKNWVCPGGMPPPWNYTLKSKWSSKYLVVQPHAINLLNATCTLNWQLAEFHSASSSPNNCPYDQFHEWTEEWIRNWAIYIKTTSILYLEIPGTELFNGAQFWLSDNANDLLNWLNSMQPTHSSKYR